jgi:hypothetical protein
MTKQYTMTIKVEFGSEFQEEFLRKLLFNLNKAWADQGRSLHSKNRLEFAIDYGENFVAKTLGFDSFGFKPKEE